MVTRLDIAFAIRTMSQFISAAHSIHCVVVLHIVHYSSNSSLKLHTYSDADYGGDVNDCTSTIRFCIFLGGLLISWLSKKQTNNSWCSTKFAHHVLANIGADLAWLCGLLKEWQFTEKSAAIIQSNNRAMIQIARNVVFH